MNENEKNIEINGSSVPEAPPCTEENIEKTTEVAKEFDIRSFNSYATVPNYPHASPVAPPPVQSEAPNSNAEGYFYSPDASSVNSCEPQTVTPDPVAEAKAFKKSARNRFSYVAFMILAMFFINTFVVGVAVSIYSLITQSTEISTTYSMIVSSLSVAFTGLPFMLLTLSKIKCDKPVKTKISIKKLLLFFTMTFAAMYGGVIIGRVVDAIIGGFLGASSDALVSGTLEGVPLWIIIIFTCVFPGIFEELIFRKLIIDKTREFGLYASVLFSGFTFGIFHGNFEQFFYALLVGTLFAYIYAKSGKIIYTIILHISLNFFGSAFHLIIEDITILYDLYSRLILLLLIGGIIAIVFEFKNNYQKLAKDKGIQLLGSTNAVLTMTLNPGMITFLAVFAYFFASMTLSLFGG